MPSRATGLAWYRREDYPRILQIMTDGYRQSAAEGCVSKLERQGDMVVRAVIDPDKFPGVVPSAPHEGRR